MPRWAKDVANSATRRYAVMTVADRPAPDFLIIGTKRGGTTSLFNYLLMHPGVLGLFRSIAGARQYGLLLRHETTTAAISGTDPTSTPSGTETRSVGTSAIGR